MPRHRSAYYNYSDISIKEYADANKKCGRIRKGVPNAIKSDAVNGDYEALDDDVNIDAKKLARVKITATDDDHVYNFFPNDIWFLISEHLRPEDVLRFALICKQTYIITTTLKFWKNLYRRYYKANIELPMRLGWDCMTRPRGYRSCAIRSLFYTYPPFVNRAQRQDFHSLTKHHVIHVWFQQINAVKFLYFYKLKRKLLPGSRLLASEELQRKDGRSIKALTDIYCNSEEGCSLLMIETTKFHPLPRLDMIESNVILSSIANLLSRSCSHYRLEIQFSNITGAKVGSAVYEPASSIRVYDWWVPTYARHVKQGLQPSLEYVKDEMDADANDNSNQHGTDDDEWDYVINNF